MGKGRRCGECRGSRTPGAQRRLAADRAVEARKQLRPRRALVSRLIRKLRAPAALERPGGKAPPRPSRPAPYSWRHPSGSTRRVVPGETQGRGAAAAPDGTLRRPPAAWATLPRVRVGTGAFSLYFEIKLWVKFCPNLLRSLFATSCTIQTDSVPFKGGIITSGEGLKVCKGLFTHRQVSSSTPL